MTARTIGAGTFPRRHAATQRFTLGAPRSFSISADGSRVVFVRSGGGDDPVGRLWVLDVASGEERCVADPADLGGADGDIPPEERARRERARESAGGIVTYAMDAEATLAVFALGVRAYVADLVGGGVREVASDIPVIAPRLSPDGGRVAFVSDRALWVANADGGDARCLARDDDPAVSWGLPDFVAAEEMDRTRGYWWAPDGSCIVVARVDENPVQRWYITDPADPAAPPREHRYPAAGTPNADVSLAIVGLDGATTPIEWDRAALPYLVDVSWRRDEPLTVVLQSRNQQGLVVLAVERDGTAKVAAEEEQQPWVELIPGFPRWSPDGRIIHPVTEPDTRRIGLGGAPVTPPGLQVRRLIDVDEQRLVFTASSDDPTAMGVWACALDGSDLVALSSTDGVADGVASGAVAVIVERSLDRPGAVATVRSPAGTHGITSHAEAPDITLNATELVLGGRGLRGMLLLPEGHDPAGGPLPVLLDPYGGPHAQRVVRSYNAHLQSQWFADQGFAVLVVDGRGSPGRGPAWEHEVAGDLATAPLEDQVDALQACAEQFPGLLDLDRVAIKGWSFGGFVAGLAILRRPDVFAAAIAGAPVTDQRLYDTHYTERYLGDPNEQPEVYASSSLLDDAHKLTKPLLIIHGLADDNVVAAHTLRFSGALLEAGRPHSVLPLSGVTHMTPQEVVAENLLHIQLHFLHTSLRLPDAS